MWSRLISITFPAMINFSPDHFGLRFFALASLYCGRSYLFLSASSRGRWLITLNLFLFGFLAWFHILPWPMSSTTVSIPRVLLEPPFSPILYPLVKVTRRTSSSVIFREHEILNHILVWLLWNIVESNVVME